MGRSRLISVVVLGIGVATAAVAYSQGIEWAIVNWKVQHDFPAVRRIDPKQLADWLSDSKRAPPVLLDVRTKAEYELSHIRGAQHIEPSTPVGIPREKPIVTYCSVGYRSAEFAKKLQNVGYKNVQNMSGSIFEWGNEGMESNRTENT